MVAALTAQLLMPCRASFNKLVSMTLYPFCSFGADFFECNPSFAVADLFILRSCFVGKFQMSSQKRCLQHFFRSGSNFSDGNQFICIEIYYYITAVKTIDFYCYNRRNL